MAESVVHMKDIAKYLTMNLKVVGMKTFCFRLWLGLQFIKIGAWVSGFGLEIEEENKPDLRTFADFPTIGGYQPRTGGSSVPPKAE